MALMAAATDLGHGIHAIDTGFVRPHFDASHLVVDGGRAAFVDVGDAKDSLGDLKPNPSYGVGARFKTPAGPFAIDLAYAQDPRKFRLAFSVTVAF